MPRWRGPFWTPITPVAGSLLRADQHPTVIGLCRRHGLTVYDALYLDLALREDAELATLDAALARAARTEGVQVA